MSTELHRLHALILASLDELDELTALPRAPMDRLPSVRLKLTRASRARTLLLEGLYDQLMARVTPQQKMAIQNLKAEGKVNLITSIRHIGSWTLPEIEKRWSDYCAASHDIRTAMRQRITQEAALLYPLLAAKLAA